MRLENSSSPSVRHSPAKFAKPPSLRTKRGKGTVSLRDRDTGERREYWLGPCDEASTREAYHRLIAQWEATGRRLPQHPVESALDNGASPSAITLGELLVAYFDHAASDGKFRTNGKTRMDRRIERDSFSHWLLEQRRRDLSNADAWSSGG